MQIALIGGETTKPHSTTTIGAKAANLARMAAIGLPVPPAFVLPVKLCAAIVNGESGAKQKLVDSLAKGIAFLESTTGKTFGDRRRPLLVSVRSGAARSMPGMLDTVLNVGCTSAAIGGLIRITGDPHFAWDCRCRLLESYADVVLGFDVSALKQQKAQLIGSENAGNGNELDAEALERLAERYRLVIEEGDQELPDTAMDQLTAAAEAVYRSWMSDRARTYRSLQHLEDLAGTAVTVQSMVYGNHPLLSGAGVAFSRDPSTGARQPVIDVLFAAQGEDVVSGRSTPETDEAIARSMPHVATELRQVLAQLEREFRDVQDVEFTIEKGKLWILQTRSAKRTPLAALRLAIALVNEGLIKPAEALQRVSDLDMNRLSYEELADAGKPIACGISASSGVATGRAAFESESAARLAASGDPVIFVRPDTRTEDVAGFALSAGIVTAVGGRTAHAALVARQMGKPCVVGCNGLQVDVSSHVARFGATVIKEGDWLSIDGGKGAIYSGKGQLNSRRPEKELAELEALRHQMEQQRQHT